MTKQVKLNPSKNAAPPSPLERAVIEVNPKEVVQLLSVVNAIQNVNPAVPASMAKFIGKNQEKLLAQHEKNGFAEQGIREKFDEYRQMVEKAENGCDIFWDGKEDNIVMKSVTEGDEQVEVIDTEKSVIGVRAFFDQTKSEKYPGGRLVDLKTNEVLDAKQWESMKPYVKDEEQRKVYDEKLVEFDKLMDELANTKSPVHVVKIDLNYMEQVRVAIPPTIFEGNTKRALSLTAFNQFLVIDDEEETETE